MNGEVRTHRLEVVRSLIPFAQGQRVVFPAPVLSVWIQFQAGPFRWFVFQLAPFLPPLFGHGFVEQIPLQY